MRLIEKARAGRQGVAGAVAGGAIRKFGNDEIGMPRVVACVVGNTSRVIRDVGGQAMPWVVAMPVVGVGIVCCGAVRFRKSTTVPTITQAPVMIQCRIAQS